MEHSADSQTFAELDSIFETHRSDEAITTLEQRVLNYEKAVHRQAELLQRQQRLSAEQEKVQQQLNQYWFY